MLNKNEVASAQRIITTLDCVVDILLNDVRSPHNGDLHVFEHELVFDAQHGGYVNRIEALSSMIWKLAYNIAQFDPNADEKKVNWRKI